MRIVPVRILITSGRALSKLRRGGAFATRRRLSREVQARGRAIGS